MFCENCGSSIADGSKFCNNCGAPISAASAPIYQPPLRESGERKKTGAGGFFSSPAGIALVVILGVAVIAGFTLGIVFLAMGGADNTVDAETVDVWEEYESILEDDSDNIPQITTDANALAQAQADLKESQEKVAALEKTLQENAGTGAWRQGTAKKATNTRDIKAAQMAAALAAYNLYIQKTNELYTALANANLLDQAVVNNLNSILAELEELGSDVNTLSNEFLEDNDQVATVKIDAPILDLASAAAAEIQKIATAAQEAEKARLEAERIAAEQAADAAAEEAESEEGQYTACPRCGAPIGVGGWCKVNTGWHCFNCGYHLLD